MQCYVSIYIYLSNYIYIYIYVCIYMYISICHAETFAMWNISIIHSSLACSLTSVYVEFIIAISRFTCQHPEA